MFDPPDQLEQSVKPVTEYWVCKETANDHGNTKLETAANTRKAPIYDPFNYSNYFQWIVPVGSIYPFAFNAMKIYLACVRLDIKLTVMLTQNISDYF